MFLAYHSLSSHYAGSAAGPGSRRRASPPARHTAASVPTTVAPSPRTCSTGPARSHRPVATCCRARAADGQAWEAKNASRPATATFLDTSPPDPSRRRARPAPSGSLTADHSCRRGE